jgi:hypothetical protein
LNFVVDYLEEWKSEEEVVVKIGQKFQDCDEEAVIWSHAVVGASKLNASFHRSFGYQIPALNPIWHRSWQAILPTNDVVSSHVASDNFGNLFAVGD